MISEAEDECFMHKITVVTNCRMRKKPLQDPRFPIFAIFSDESGAYSQQQPGVNLMQMMIPVGRSTTANTVI